MFSCLFLFVRMHDSRLHALISILFLLNSLLGCESTALYSLVPQDVIVDINPPFLIDEAQRCTLTFTQFTHLSVEDDPMVKGDEQIVKIDLGEDIRLKSWEFTDDFEVQLELEPIENAPYGEHEVSVTVRNRFGEFDGKGVIFVF